MTEQNCQNIAFTLAYLGTAYHGWQYQNNAISIQQVMQEAIEKATGQAVTLSGCGRTDAGVHAKIYVANAKLATRIPLDKLPLAISAYLPEDISVSRATAVPDDFDARFSCRRKEYSYLIHNSRVRNPFYHNRTYFCPSALDDDAMAAAAPPFRRPAGFCRCAQCGYAGAQHSAHHVLLPHGKAGGPDHGAGVRRWVLSTWLGPSPVRCSTAAYTRSSRSRCPPSSGQETGEAGSTAPALAAFTYGPGIWDGRHWMAEREMRQQDNVTPFRPDRRGQVCGLFKSVALIGLLCSMVYCIWITHDSLSLSSLRQLFSYFSSARQASSGDFAGYTFEAGTESVYDDFGNGLAVLNSDSLSFINEQGAEELSVQLQYATPALSVSGDNLLAYDPGGRGLLPDQPVHRYVADGAGIGHHFRLGEQQWGLFGGH